MNNTILYGYGVAWSILIGIFYLRDYLRNPKTWVVMKVYNSPVVMSFTGQQLYVELRRVKSNGTFDKKSHLIKVAVEEKEKYKKLNKIEMSLVDLYRKK